MSSLTQDLKAFAAERRVDLLGIAPIERFEGVPAQHHPSSIFPETRFVIVVGKRITRGTFRGLEEGTQLDAYDQYGRSWLIDRVLAMATIHVATFLEDAGYEPVPLQDLPTQVPPSGVPVRPGAPAPNVIVDARDAAVRAGLGEIGLSGELLTPRFGPRQRLQLILTDAPLEPTPLLDKPVCDRCMACVRACPLGAINADALRTVSICGKEMPVAAIDDRVCRSCRNGARPNAYHPAGSPDRLGAVCNRTCIDALERAERVQGVFAAPFRKRPAWQVDASGRAGLQDGE